MEAIGAIIGAALFLLTMDSIHECERWQVEQCIEAGHSEERCAEGRFSYDLAGGRCEREGHYIGFPPKRSPDEH